MQIKVGRPDAQAPSHEQAGRRFTSECFVVLGVTAPFVPAVSVFILRPQADH
jgi:hypothetical protein